MNASTLLGKVEKVRGSLLALVRVGGQNSPPGGGAFFEHIHPTSKPVMSWKGSICRDAAAQMVCEGETVTAENAFAIKKSAT